MWWHRQALTIQVMPVDETRGVFTRQEKSSPGYTALCDESRHRAVRCLEKEGRGRSTFLKRNWSLCDIEIEQVNKNIRVTPLAPAAATYGRCGGGSFCC